MEEKTPLLKRLDLWLFSQLDDFRKTPSFTKLHEFYSGIDEDKQKLSKWLLFLSLIALPLIASLLLWFQNRSIEQDLANRVNLIEQMQAIIAQNGEIGGLVNNIASPTALTSESDASGRLTSLLSGAAIDQAKVRIGNFTSENVSAELIRAEADFSFNGLTTEQLVSLFNSLMQVERFRIATVEINRNSSNNLLDGKLHAVHFGNLPSEVVEE